MIQFVTPSLPCAKAERLPMVTAVYTKNFADLFALSSLILRFSHYFLFPSHGVLALLVSANVFFLILTFTPHVCKEIIHRYPQIPQILQRQIPRIPKRFAGVTARRSKLG